ncbi:hypothetical protein [Albibacterium profundi]|uniref:Ppx/GppA phosphatase domain-containing protein n=1 Tax=Albibacterium profundi TaxID=3134906 RepID=A0ABV5CD37_9SPHI
MSKVFRFHNGNNNIEDWQITEAYGSNAISAIQDPAGESASREITSIPSPFARIDLIQTAFRRLNESRQVDGDSIYHKMVSDTLDVAELFFNLDRFQDRLKLVVWDKHQDLKELLNSSNPKHKRLGETLKLYLDQDKDAHNFDSLNSIYLLDYYQGGPRKMNIIGGTSPSTLFFTSANDLSYVNIQFGIKKVFSSQYQALYQRDIEFQKYLYGMQKHWTGFQSKFHEIDGYLNENYSRLRDDVKQAIQGLTEAEFNNAYTPITIGGDGNMVEVLGFPIRKKIAKPTNIADQSDFVIASDKYEGLKPLVLPNEKFSNKLQYTTDHWDANLKAPHVDTRDMSERKLPFVGDQYPYLTVSDLLEPYLIRTVYPLQKSAYFDGNLSAEKSFTKGFILPIKKAFFDYFDTDFLLGHTANGQPAFEMRLGAGGGVTVTLRVPVKKGTVSFQRIYYPSSNELSIEEADIENNKGIIVENQFSLTTFPFYKLPADYNQVYRIALMDRDVLPLTKSRRYSLSFFKNRAGGKGADLGAANANAETTIKAEKSRSRKSADGLSSHFYVLEDDFDYMVVKDGAGHQGIVLPLFEKIEPGTESFTFAVDFGTTNTHIEYRKNDLDPQPFEIGEDDLQMASLHDPKIEETDISLSGTGAAALILTLPHEFLPLKVGRKLQYGFPTRTAIHYNDATDFTSSTYALADLNLSFTYEKELIPKNIKFDTNLKWSDFKANTKELKKVDAYFENLMLLIRNKVILNGGNPDKTDLVWFYPSSMLPFKIGMMEFKWENLFSRYITDKRSPMKLSESIAPFYYFKNRLGVTATERPVVSIDIGGGTSDMVVYTKNRPEVLTSMRFAANTIFGDAYNSNPALNGFVKKYTEKFKDLGIVSYYLPKLQRSDDIAGFFFSLENNRDLQKRNHDASFAKELRQDADFRMVFLLFYSAIIYHLAKLMKAKGLDKPAYITFSGTGSKVIDFADPRPKLKGLGKLTEAIFSEVYTAAGLGTSETDGDGRPDEDVDILAASADALAANKAVHPMDGAIELKQYENPKEITCKGGLMIDEEIEIEDIKSVLLGDEKNTLLEDKALTYSDINNELTDSVLVEYNNFIDLFFKLHQDMNFSKEFGANPSTITLAQTVLRSKAKEFLLLGIEQQLKELNEDQNVEISDSLFFYPLVGVLNKLAFNIYEEEEVQ